MTIQEAREILLTANTWPICSGANEEESIENLHRLEEAMWLENQSILLKHRVRGVLPSFKEGRALTREFLRGWTGEASVVVARQIAEKLNLNLDNNEPEPFACSICKREIKGQYSNNARPVTDGRCCDECNAKVVIPARMASGNPSAR